MIWRVGPGEEERSLRDRAVFLDRDGVVIADRHYLADPDGVELLAGVPEAMGRLRRAGYWLIGLSNQSGIGRGRFTLEDHAAVMTRLDELLAADGVGFDGFFFCPHAPNEACACRKPATGLIEEAATFFDWEPATSWIVGDKASDIELGLAAGLHGALVRTGHGRNFEAEFRDRWAGRDDLMLMDDLPAVVDAILSENATRDHGAPAGDPEADA